MVTQAILALSWATVLGLVAALIFSGVVKGVLGVGPPLILVPLTTQFPDVPVAVALLAVPMIATNIGQALEGGRTRRGSDEWAHAADENLSRRPARVRRAVSTSSLCHYIGQDPAAMADFLIETRASSARGWLRAGDKSNCLS